MNMYILLSIITAIVCPAVSEMGHWDGEFQFSTYMEENHQYRLYWSILDDDVIEIGMEVWRYLIDSDGSISPSPRYLDWRLKFLWREIPPEDRLLSMPKTG